MNRQELQKKVRHTVHQLIWEKGYASPLDLFLGMEKISPKLVEEWRFRRVPYLERVLHGNLGQFSFIMKEFRKTAREMNLKESYTAYMSWGKGKKSPLRFSKSGNSQVEQHYSTHYVKPPIPGQAQLKPALEGINQQQGSDEA
ncbi:hypothetical protein Back11_43700 [Paenibacillus baekrokdamisoli]|uniref:Uncharacterized protein n=1 Tax=Paenibacillus baekrokdamisoli TaxID=1712516 RepID=A0A3G9J3U9_9BACL|nr:hypothetical protein [Paenibacillus baekrokdamisoli]MBB3067928.1 hypothetical protein [Paenibacillus baekrokdamisoli]BBH23025.1 hypothetical protein Back11_43700 [Paenibacillus baekrokdamisoli]